MKRLSEQGSVVLNLRVPAELARDIEAEAKRSGLSVSEVVRNAISASRWAWSLEPRPKTRIKYATEANDDRVTEPDRKTIDFRPRHPSQDCEHEWKNVGWATICDKCKARR